ncbi:ribonuclease R [candidate division KSB3 bacterium]|uniref:Ribonuclease R n=1 Tax=candidate division KSB3 bacterium TaxID=2044937 RepID=A0A2G6EBC6_9BACT|nr:MAG: ribonuclease R [candidate division KSB3 bacterium]PIE30686.1 MAG: ribonuclease R [candidate division KSB3 bacterium]
MIDKSCILEFIRSMPFQTITEKDLLKRLYVESDERHEAKRLLRELVVNGDIVESKKHTYALPGTQGLIVGSVHSTRKGSAFIVSGQQNVPDIYVSHGNLANAFHGDRVVVRLLQKKNGASEEGEVVRILQRGANRLVGRYDDRGDYAFVIPENTRLPYKIYVDASHAGQAKAHQIVAAHILNFGNGRHHPEGEVVDVLGYPDTQGIDEKIITYSYNLPTKFPDAALEQAEHFRDGIPAEELARRLDLRETCIFTIDGENARDFDDAISIEGLDNAHYKLGVHIADVDYYVKEGDPLDLEACRRGTSIYFPDRAIPMFPERLSNNLCSLREGKDRLTMTVFMVFSPTMDLLDYEIRPSVIRSKAQLSYTEVRRMLKEKDNALRTQHNDLLPSLELIKELSELLFQRRMRRGSLDFDLPEPEIVLDMLGNVENIFKAERNLAHRIIEECMIAANETVASHLNRLQIPSLYRTHDKPDPGNIASLNALLHSLGIGLRSDGELHPKDLQRSLKQVHGKPGEHIVNMIALRSMKQARYTLKNTGHFGLASTCYTHCTSPIRRYPDLIIHRLLKEHLAGGAFSKAEKESRQKQLQRIAQHATLSEHNASEAQRELLHVKKLRFMEAKQGQTFEGVISGVACFGVFVNLRDFFVEGLIHVSSLHDDFYHYHEGMYSLVGEQFHKRYQVGDIVRVKVAHVDVAKRQIDFLLAS